eukprot:s59_g63.t1
MSSPPVLLGHLRCAVDEPGKGVASCVEVTESEAIASSHALGAPNQDQKSQTLWIQRWTHRTFLCLAAIVAACLSGALAYVFYHSKLAPDDASSFFLVCFLIASNALAGGTAVLLWLIAPTQHLLLAARFLMLNWFGGLSSLFLIELRQTVLVFELLGLQYLAQDRLKSIWPALNSPRWGACLGRAFWLEFGLLSFSYLMTLVAILLYHWRISMDFFYVIIWVLTFSWLFSTLLFLMWVLGVATTLCRVVLMLRRTLQMARKEENSIAVQSLLACRRRSFWQAIGFLASLATTVILFKVTWNESVQAWNARVYDGVRHYRHLHIPTFSFAVAQCINSVVNVAGVILLSKAYRIFKLPGSVRPPALSWTSSGFGCQVCPRSRMRHDSDADAGIVEGSDWEAKTEELASRGISLSDLVEFYSTLGVIAVDANLNLFSRAWCMAELAEAHRMGMLQSLMLRNNATLLARQSTLQHLRVEDMKASRPEDVQQILAKIPDKKAFNQKLQDLIFDGQVGLLAARKKADVLEQMEDLSYVLKWARLSENVNDGALIWRRWICVSGRPMQGQGRLQEQVDP